MKYRWILLLVLAGIAFYGLATFAADPLLYAPEKDLAASVFHQNPAVFRQGTITSTNDIVPLMQDVIDGQKPVVLDLRANDTTTVERDLARYDNFRSALQDKVARYGMKGGEISPFLAGTEDQRVVLHELVRQSEALNGLITAGERTSVDADAKATIVSQTAALKETERTLLKRYLQNCSAVLKISTKVGLDTRSYEAARGEIQDILQEIETVPEIKPVNLTVPAADRITLLIEPMAAVYGDTVQVYGIATPAQENQSVVILIDTAPFMTGTTDKTGNYYSRFMVERLVNGNHIISATTGNIASPQQVLAVSISGTTTTLNAEPGYRNNSETGAYCDGTVMAERPVKNAPVTILADGNPAMTVTTAENGTFREFLPLSGGGHTITAQFSADGYPLNPSFSSPVSIVVPAAPIRLIDILGVAVLVLLVLGIAAFWLLRPRPEPSPGEEEILGEIIKTAPEPTGPDAPEIPPEIGTLLARYEEMLRKQGLSEAARRAYLDLAGRIAAKIRLKTYRTLTPREMSRACAGRSYGGIFDIFVDSYERIRYGGSARGEDRTGFEEELQVADAETGRGQA